MFIICIRITFEIKMLDSIFNDFMIMPEFLIKKSPRQYKDR